MASEKKRIIMHLDMDHFYTAVEERQRPELKGKPVVVGADPKEGAGRGVVMTSNYEARKFKVRSGMPISKAWKLCPDAVFLRPNFVLYEEVSERIMDVLRGFGDGFEQWGIDEAFLDVSSRVRDFVEAEGLARQIKREILEGEGLTCSIGVGPNKLVAKVASDFQKPDGLTVVLAEEAEVFLAPLSVRKLLWVGRKTEQKLAGLGVKTVGDLARFDPAVLIETFGVVGTQLYLMAHAVDESPVEERGEVKSISRERTFEVDTSDFEAVLGVVDRLSEMVHEDVMGHSMFFRTVTVKLRYENFETHLRGRTLPRYTNSLADLKKAARELTKAYLRADRAVRLVGVKVSNFTPAGKQKTLI